MMNTERINGLKFPVGLLGCWHWGSNGNELKRYWLVIVKHG